MSEGERRLAAIMFTDIVGYTSLTQKDESGAMQALEEHRRLLRPYFASHRGREVKTVGDAFLVEFESALDAVLCATAIQNIIHDRSVATGVTISLRIGVHMGDVIESGSDILGDAVNVASRIEPLAEPGGVCISGPVYEQVKNKVPYLMDKIVNPRLKNVSEPIDVYRLTLPWARPQHSESTVSLLDPNRIAVLPFVNMSPDPNDEYFADGMTEELLDRLAQVKSLKVIARTSVMSYKGEKKKASQIAKELEVGTLVEGSVRKAGNRVRVTVQLITAGTEEHLWSSHYDKDLDDIFTVQSEIAEKVAAELKVHLLDSEKKTLETKPTENTEAYTLYLRGRQLVGERTEPSFRQALGLFERAIALDPSFAKAYAGVAASYVSLTMDGYDPYERTAPRAELFAKKALSLNPELAEAHATLADVRFLEDDLRGSEAEARRAIELNPSLPETYDLLSDVALMKEDIDEGVRTMEAAYRLDPVMPRVVGRLGRIYFYIGREKDALQHWEKTLQLAPADTFRNMTEYYLYKGDIEKARECYSKAEELEPTNRWCTWMRGFMAALTGDQKGALEVIKEIEARWLGATNLNDIAFIHYALGDLDSYFAYIDRATDQHTLRYAYVLYCPLFGKAREDPRYQFLLGKLRKLNAVP
ncbi:MAG: hypothetical protein JRM73_05110 [Nitrososphaerota archaeon]|nr:hypothetical protein [Nitrososphaerota archaeon]